MRITWRENDGIPISEAPWIHAEAARPGALGAQIQHVDVDERSSAKRSNDMQRDGLQADDGHGAELNDGRSDASVHPVGSSRRSIRAARLAARNRKTR